MSSRENNHVMLLLIYNLRHYVEEMTETGAEKLDEQTTVISICRLKYKHGRYQLITFTKRCLEQKTCQ